jgi:hypothetical protein
MRYQTPQFIETETKVVGPFTLKQFLFVAGGVSMTAMSYFLLDGIFFALAALIILGFFGALAFLRVDGQPFLNYLAYVLSFSLGAKRYEYKPPQNTNIPSAH